MLAFPVSVVLTNLQAGRCSAGRACAGEAEGRWRHAAGGASELPVSCQ